MTGDRRRGRLLAGASVVALILLAGLTGWMSLEEGRRALGTADPEQSRPLARWDAEWHLEQARISLDRSDQDEAERQIRRAIELRPRWPAAYVALSRLFLDQDRLEGLDHADQALELGPNDSHVFVSLLPYWLFHWRDLGPDQRQAVMGMVDRLGGRFPDWVVETAQRYGQVYTVCDRLEFRTRATRACDRSGWQAAAPNTTKENP